MQDQIIQGLQSLGYARGKISVQLYQRSISAPPADSLLNRSGSQCGTIMLYGSNTPGSDGANSGGNFTPYTPLANNISLEARLSATVAAASQMHTINETSSNELKKREKPEMVDGLEVQGRSKEGVPLTFSFNSHSNNGGNNNSNNNVSDNSDDSTVKLEIYPIRSQFGFGCRII
jgi:hypothetical protein